MMTSCFFCQNLLSDYVEGVLPSSRHEELRHHLETCKACSEAHQDLSATLSLLKAIPSKALSSDMALRILEASQSRKAALLSPRVLSRVTLAFCIPVLLALSAIYAFPSFFPWLERFRPAVEESQFVRYYPLLQGASEIIEEQSSWLHLREPFMRSVWEEGGLSPEEFEKTFQVKGAKGEP